VARYILRHRVLAYMLAIERFQVAKMTVTDYMTAYDRSHDFL